MNGRDGPKPSSLDHPLWSAISLYSIGKRGAPLPFTHKLARENGWSLAEAERVVAEYKRFCFLAMTAGHEVTPSDAVDQAWHLHLTWSRDYWERFCPHVLRGPLHHEPGGGAEDRHRHFLAYAETLKSYERAFGESAPSDLWPSAAQRFLQDPKARRVHPRDAFIIPRRAGLFLLLMLACAAFLAFLLLR